MGLAVGLDDVGGDVVLSIPSIPGESGIYGIGSIVRDKGGKCEKKESHRGKARYDTRYDSTHHSSIGRSSCIGIIFSTKDTESSHNDEWYHHQDAESSNQHHIALPSLGEKAILADIVLSHLIFSLTSYQS